MHACVQLHAIHNSKANYEEPEKFLPERWLEPGAEYARPRAGADGAVSGEHLCLALAVVSTLTTKGLADAVVVPAKDYDACAASSRCMVCPASDRSSHGRA